MSNYRKKPVVIEAWLAKDITYAMSQNWNLGLIPESVKEAYEKGGLVFMTNGEIHIQTLEGTMVAEPTDYIIRGVNGEFYPCKPDIFFKTYDMVDIQAGASQYHSFGEVIKFLTLGYAVTRKGWNGKGLFVFMQVPSQISIDIVPHMQSLPARIKDQFIDRVMTRDKKDEFETISYSNQLAIVHPDNTINGWVPSVSDIFANDWIIL